MDLISVDITILTEAVSVYAAFFLGVFLLSGIVDRFANRS